MCGVDRAPGLSPHSPGPLRDRGRSTWRPRASNVVEQSDFEHSTPGLSALLAATKRCDARTTPTRCSEATMTMTEFLSYLLDHDSSHELALELADVHRLRVRQSERAGESELVPA